jgi:hypothetical protein
VREEALVTAAHVIAGLWLGVLSINYIYEQGMKR